MASVDKSRSLKFLNINTFQSPVVETGALSLKKQENVSRLFTIRPQRQGLFSSDADRLM